MFQFPAFAPALRRCQAFSLTGCPFFASESLGILRPLFSCFLALVFCTLKLQSLIFSAMTHHHGSMITDFRFFFTSLSFPVLSMILPVLGPAAVILQRLKASFPLFPLSSPKKRHFIYRNRRSDSKKEVFQPHLPVRLPCYDLAPVTGFALGRSFRSRTSGTPGSHGLTGGCTRPGNVFTAPWLMRDY